MKYTRETQHNKSLKVVELLKLVGAPMDAEVRFSLRKQSESNNEYNTSANLRISWITEEPLEDTEL